MPFPAHFPVIATPRLRLRAYTPADVPELQRLASRAEVAATTMAIPHPYPDGAAASWIATHTAKWAAHDELILAITLKATHELLGSISLTFTPAFERAEMGYWIGVPHWGRGYATEAARALIDYGFGTLRLNRIQAHHMAENLASGRVMEKVGLTREGCSPQALKKNGRFHDLIFYGVLREDWAETPGPRGSLSPDKALA
jgi:[ribosomal protein S5]-alanine N-acetyltransferase